MGIREQFKQLFSASDISIAGLLIVIVALMVIPIPTFLLDLLMIINVAISVMVLLVAMYLSQPLDFAAFPSILLVITLFRLSINVSTTKLVLSLGPDFDGHVVLAFADFVTRGNFVVGVVAFAIITLVQFLVVTKGSERVSEVAARFTLDAMPGKQMSIDADLNAGIIDANEARTRRKKLERESTFFGSMDGANKFVKGDAIAGIVILLINIVGGILIGRFQQNLTIGDSIQTYARLTIGDGLTAQIPALLVSIATGLVVTKSASEESLGSDVAKQILSQPKAFASTSIILFLFSLVPGLPFLPFFMISSGCGIVAVLLIRTKLTASESVAEAQQESAKQALKKPENLLGTLNLDPISLKTGRNLVPLIDPSQNGPLLERITLVRYHIGQDLGFVIPGVRVMDDLSLPPNQYVIDIRGTKVDTGEAPIGYVYVNKSLSELKKKGITGVESTDPITGAPTTWVPEDQIDQLQTHGFQSVGITDYISNHFSEIIKRHADEIMTRQNVQSLMEVVKNSNAAIVRELVPDLLSLGQVHKVLQSLVRERVSIRDLSTILERLADYANVSRDTNLLSEYVRQALARQLCGKFVDDDDIIVVFTIDPKLEETMLGAIHQSEYGSFLALDPHLGEKILTQIGQQMDNFQKMDRLPVGLCSPRLRPHFKRFTERMFPNLSILSYNEIVTQVKVQSIGIISAAV